MPWEAMKPSSRTHAPQPSEIRCSPYADRGRTRIGAAHHGVGADMSDTRRSESGFPIEPVYGPDDLAGWDHVSELGTPGRVPVYARRLPDDVHGSTVDDAAVRRVWYR